MTKTGRKAAITTAAVGALLWTSSTYSATGTDAHIRSDSADINAAIDQASERSATFRQLVRTIEGSDSIVFVTEGDCGHNEHACFTNVTTAGPRRIMWLTIDLRKAEAEWDVMGSIAHELRHTIEVISSPGVRSFGEKFGLYSRIGFQEKGGGFETLAALDAGNAVRDEVRSFVRHFRSRENRSDRPTVTGSTDTFNGSTVSSTERPLKNRISTTCALRESNAASSLRASSSEKLRAAGNCSRRLHYVSKNRDDFSGLTRTDEDSIIGRKRRKQRAPRGLPRQENSARSRRQNDGGEGTLMELDGRALTAKPWQLTVAVPACD